MEDFQDHTVRKRRNQSLHSCVSHLRAGVLSSGRCCLCLHTSIAGSELRTLWFQQVPEFRGLWFQLVSELTGPWFQLVPEFRWRKG